jgi:hypothetical protein
LEEFFRVARCKDQKYCLSQSSRSTQKGSPYPVSEDLPENMTDTLSVIAESLENTYIYS